MTVEQLIKKHTALKFPSFPVNDEFADWMSDLAEYDGYIIGLVSSSHITIQEFTDLEAFLRRLTLSKKPLLEDELVLEEVRDYCHSLLNVARASLDQRVMGIKRDKSRPTGKAKSHLID